MIRGLAESGVTILLTTQYLEEADQLAARIAVIDHGKKIAEGTSRELKAATGSGFLHVALADPARLEEAAAHSGAAAGTSCPAQHRGCGTLQPGRDGESRQRGARRVGRRRHRAVGFLDGSAEPRRSLLRPDGTTGSGRRPEGRQAMSDATSLQRLQRVARPARPSAISNALVFGWRAVLKFKHVPEQLFDLVMTPIMFTLLFTFVFGGALAGSPARVSAVLPARHSGPDRRVQRGLFGHGTVDGSQQGPVRPLPLAADLVACAVRRPDGGRYPAPSDRRIHHPYDRSHLGLPA